MISLNKIRFAFATAILLMAVSSLQAGNAPTQLGFDVQPVNTTVGVPMTNVVVQLKDKNGTNAIQSGILISLSLNKAGILQGTTNAVTDSSGKAKFSNLLVMTTGNGLSFLASATGLKGANSRGFSVGKTPTSTTLTTSLNPAPTNQNITFSAVITAAATVKPSGVIQFKANGNPLGSPISLTNGLATFTVLAASLGSTNPIIVAEFSDATGKFDSSTNRIMQLVTIPVAAAKDCKLSLTPVIGHKGWFNTQLIGATATKYVIQASTDMVNWVNISTNTTDVSGTLSLQDSNTASLPARFYRAYAP